MALASWRRSATRRAGDVAADRVGESPAEVWDLLGDLVGESRAQPRLIVVAEFAALGPALNLVVGGQDGVERYRQAVRADEVRFIPLYRAVLAALLRRVPAGALLGGLVDRAVEHDHRENAHLMAAFDLLDPPDGTQPRVWVASRHTGPAALHAGVKFALLLPAVVPAVAVAAGLALRAGPGGRPALTHRAASCASPADQALALVPVVMGLGPVVRRLPNRPSRSNQNRDPGTRARMVISQPSRTSSGCQSTHPLPGASRP
jgi:hypothetical protein